jgi:predicted CopG family antitoxin
MTQIILKNDLEESKLNALLNFLRSFDIEAEVKTNKKKRKEPLLSSFFGTLSDTDAEAMIKEIEESRTSKETDISWVE